MSGKLVLEVSRRPEKMSRLLSQTQNPLQLLAEDEIDGEDEEKTSGMFCLWRAGSPVEIPDEG